MKSPSHEIRRQLSVALRLPALMAALALQLHATKPNIIVILRGSLGIKWGHAYWSRRQLAGELCVLRVEVD